MITTSLCSLPFYDFCAQAKCLDADTGAKHVSCARVISGATGFISLPNPVTREHAYSGNEIVQFGEGGTYHCLSLSSETRVFLEESAEGSDTLSKQSP